MKTRYVTVNDTLLFFYLNCQSDLLPFKFFKLFNSCIYGLGIEGYSSTVAIHSCVCAGCMDAAMCQETLVSKLSRSTQSNLETRNGLTSWTLFIDTFKVVSYSQIYALRLLLISTWLRLWHLINVIVPNKKPSSEVKPPKKTDV